MALAMTAWGWSVCAWELDCLCSPLRVPGLEPDLRHVVVLHDTVASSGELWRSQEEGHSLE